MGWELPEATQVLPSPSGYTPPQMPGKPSQEQGFSELRRSPGAEVSCLQLPPGENPGRCRVG